MTKNGTTIGEDSFTILPAEIDDRQAATDELDRRWNAMTQTERSEAVSQLQDFNEFLGSIAHATDRSLDQAIDLAKEAYPQYADFDEDLAKAIVKVESHPYGNYFSIGSKEELGLGQDKFYRDINRTPAAIKPRTNFQGLRKSDLSDQEFEDFKTETFADNRSLVIESLAILFAHVTEDLIKRDYIGNDIKKIAAGYNWGQNHLKKWLDFCTEKSIDWYENLDNENYELEGVKLKGRENAVNYIKSILDNYPRK